MASAWTAEEQRKLEEGLRACSHITDPKEKWRRIAECVGTRGAKECVERFKKVRQEVLASQGGGAAAIASDPAPKASSAPHPAPSPDAKSGANATSAGQSAKAPAAEGTGASCSSRCEEPVAGKGKPAGSDAPRGSAISSAAKAADVPKQDEARQPEKDPAVIPQQLEKAAEAEPKSRKNEGAQKKGNRKSEQPSQVQEKPQPKDIEASKEAVNPLSKQEPERAGDKEPERQDKGPKDKGGNATANKSKASDAGGAGPRAKKAEEEKAKPKASEAGGAGPKAKKAEEETWRSRGVESTKEVVDPAPEKEHECAGDKEPERQGTGRNGKAGKDRAASKGKGAEAGNAEAGDDGAKAWRAEKENWRWKDGRDWKDKKGSWKDWENGDRWESWRSDHKDAEGPADGSGAAGPGAGAEGDAEARDDGAKSWWSERENWRSKEARDEKGKKGSRKGSDKGDRRESWRDDHKDAEGPEAGDAEAKDDAGKGWRAEKASWRSKDSRDEKGKKGSRKGGAADGSGGAEPGAGTEDKTWQRDGKRGEGKGKGKGGDKGEKGKRGKGAPAEELDAEAKAAREAAREAREEERDAREALLPLAERLALQLKRGSYECMICMAKIGRGAPTWHCSNCHAVFHLKCVHGWIRKSNEEVLAGKGKGRVGDKKLTWPCPGCRYIHVYDRLPEYTCFCGRILEPEQTPHCTPHSCGEPCSRRRPNCSHGCPELCHPGPCPPCTAIGPPGGCYCGREHKNATRCGEPQQWTCGKPCDRPLACGSHNCPLRCHSGKCPPCEIKKEQTCHCGKVTKEMPCGSKPFNCGQVCGQPLNCGHHTCDRLCHPGKCGDCRFTPERWGMKCACGKTDTSDELAAAMLVRFAPHRESCADRLSLCGNKCGRISLSGCGHKCDRPCHEGPCGECKVEVTQKCRCGRSERKIDCHTAMTENGGVYLCKQPCNTKKSCQKHKCQVLCCEHRDVREHEVHLCLMVCGRQLECGEHQCEEFCHLGHCPPCRVVRRTPLTCTCGAAQIQPPVRCGTALPLCSRPCGQPLECGHRCAALCHPGEHPECTQLVSKMCVGGHVEMPEKPCFMPAMSCGRPCGAVLPLCGHRCRKPCHAGECPRCEETCGAFRVFCEHRCVAPCHADTERECPDVPCVAKVKVSCKCGSRVESVVCGAYSRNPRPQFANLPCGPGCRAFGNAGPGLSDGALREDVLRFDPELVQLARYAGVQYVRFLEQRFEDVMPPARPGTKTSIGLSKADLEGGRRLLTVELARVHYGLCHRSELQKDGTLLVSIWVAPGSGGPRRPQERKLSVQVTDGGSQAQSFGADAPSVLFACGSAKDEAAEEFVYELLVEEGAENFRLRTGSRGSWAARFASPAAAAAAFQRLTRQVASTTDQALRRHPTEKDRAERVSKLGVRPLISLEGGGVQRALAELKQRSAAAANASAAGGSAWGAEARAARAAGPAPGSAWGAEARAARAAGPAPSAWGKGGKPAAPAPAPAASAAPAAPAPAPSAAACSSRDVPAEKPREVAAPAEAAAPPKPEPVEVPDNWEDDVPDNWDDSD